MTIVIDSITPSPECLETPPSAATTDRCEVVAEFHLREGTGSSTVATTRSETIPFARELNTSSDPSREASFYLQSTSLPPSLSELLVQHGFDFTDESFQWDLDHLVRVHTGYAGGRRRVVDSDPVIGAELGVLFDDLMSHIFLGEIESPDSVQLEANRSLVMRLGAIPDRAQGDIRIAIESFHFENRGLLEREDPSAFIRAERLAFILPVLRRLTEATALISGAAGSERSGHLREARAEILAHLFTGEPSLSSLFQHLTALAIDIYGETPDGFEISGDIELERTNLYQILAPVLQALREERPFNERGVLQTRLETLIRRMEQPVQTRVLEYSLLEPSQALVQSVLDSLLEPSQTEALLETVEDEIEAPDLDAEWLQENGHLREIVEAFFSAISAESGGEGRYRLTLDTTQLRDHLNEVFQNHLVENREHIGGALAVLRFLTSRDSLRVYWEGEMRDISWTLTDPERARIRSIDRWMASQIRTSLTETDIVLPIVEGVICAAGIGLTAWGIADNSLSSDARLGLQVGGGGATGLGCGSLLTHFILDTPNHYISDSIAGGIGLLLGIGIPLLVNFLGGSNMMPPPGLPMDGRTPSHGWGP